MKHKRTCVKHLLNYSPLFLGDNCYKRVFHSFPFYKNIPKELECDICYCTSLNQIQDEKLNVLKHPHGLVTWNLFLWFPVTILVIIVDRLKGNQIWHRMRNVNKGTAQEGRPSFHGHK